MNIWLLIALMAIVTFTIRYSLYARADKVSLPPKLAQALASSGVVPPVKRPTRHYVIQKVTLEVINKGLRL